MAQFKGKALLVTFIYTRCPTPNFCPLITKYFAEINRQIAADSRLASRTHLLSVSFDPEHDTSARLRAFGVQYIGSDTQNTFTHWDFAVPGKADLQRMAMFFDLAIQTGDDRFITHTLSTTLIGPDGKVVRFYSGNDWTPAQVIADLKQIAAIHG
jgi:protein SCO1/2